MKLATLKKKSELELEPLFLIKLVTRGLSFSEYLVEIGSGSIFDTSTISDSRDFSRCTGQQNLELFTVSGIESLNFDWLPEVLKLGLMLCPYEVAFEILDKHTNSDLLKVNHYLAIEKGIFILGKEPIFLAESWLESKWLLPKLEDSWIFCREIP